VAGSENVPGSQDGGRKAGIPNDRVALGAHFDISSHTRRRMCHAHVNEMLHSGETNRGDGFFHGTKIDMNELARLGRAGVRCADEMNDGVIGAQAPFPCHGIKHIGNDGFAAGRQFAFGGFLLCPTPGVRAPD
jgi:hypothetical protein